MFEFTSAQAGFWLARALVDMILSDGKVSSEEIEEFQDKVAHLVDVQQLQSLVEALRLRTPLELESIEIDFQDGFEIIKDLTRMAMIDHSLSGKEEKFLYHCARKLGLPDDVTDLLVEKARKGVNASLEVRLTYKNMQNDVIGVNWSQTACTLFTDFPIEQGTAVRIEVKDSIALPPHEHFNAIPATILSCRASRQIENRYLLDAEFKTRLTIQHGVLHHLLPHKFDQAQSQLISLPFSHLNGIKATCRICGDKEVLIWQLQTGFVQTHNIFGIQAQLNPGGGNTLAGVPIACYLPKFCPRCLFVSDAPDFCYAPGNAVHPEPLFHSGFRQRWLTTLVRRREAYGLGAGERLNLLERNTEDGIKLWELAHQSCLALAEDNPQFAVGLSVRAALAQMHQAELYLALEKPARAGEHQKRARGLVDQVLPKTKGLSRARLLALQAMICLYDGTPRVPETCLKQVSSIETAGEEEQACQSILKTLERIVEQREAYSWKRLSSYAKTEEVAGLSPLGSTIDYLE
jgi:uncharacterized tellurite resistance protein B-like protein